MEKIIKRDGREVVFNMQKKNQKRLQTLLKKQQ